MNRLFITRTAAVQLFNRTFSPPLSSHFHHRRTFHSVIKPVSINITLNLTFRVQYFSSASKTPVRRRRSKKKKEEPELAAMEEEKNAFYVVRKGDIVGVYKNLSDCQAQVGSSVCDPSVSVYKGYSFPKEAEEYLTSRGLKNAIYTMNAADAKADLFGALVPCPFQQPALSKDTTSNKLSPPKRSQEVLESTSNLEEVGFAFPGDTLIFFNEEFGSVFPGGTLSRKHLKLDNSAKTQPNHRKCVSCTLEFDGASKGNPGISGAGAVLKADDGSLVYRLREGVGIATNNVAEYRALLLGLKHALKKGFSRIRVQGDSKLVCMQVQGIWKCKNENMATLCEEVKNLVNAFAYFQISHVLRDFNSAADAEANLSLNLKDGEVEEICEEN